jgi:hypothetical protein
MTPPRDEDATCEHFAPVIPLRRREYDSAPDELTETAEPDSRDLWDPDCPLASLTARRLPRDSPTGAPTGARTIAAPSLSRNGEAPGAEASRRARSVQMSRRRGWVVAACSVLAAAALARTLTGAGHPATTHLATVAPRVAITTSVKHAAPPTQTKPRSRRVAAPRDQRSAPPTKHSRTTAPRLARVTASTHASLTDTAVSESATTSTAAPLQAPPTHQTARTANRLEAVRRSSASACVPGELGC